MFEQTSKTKKAVKSRLENNTILSQTTVLDIARSSVGEFLPLQSNGYACTTEQLLDVLLAVSCLKETIAQVCSDIKIKVGAESIRRYFNDPLKVENLDGLQEAVNLALQKSFSLELKWQKLEIAFVVLGGSFPTERICVIFQSNDGKAI